MNVLLVSPNVESLPDPVFPLGLAQLSAILKRDGINHEILDLCFSDDYDSSIESALHSVDPDVVGLSLRNIDNVSYPHYITYLPFYRKVIETIRKHGDPLIVLGGSAFALLPDELISYLDADVGIIGEGEAAFLEFLRQCERSSALHKYKGSRIIDGRHGKFVDLDALPLPDRTGFDNEGYLRWGGMGNIQTKRGCPFTCIYCTYPIIEGARVRLRNPGRICDEIEQMLDLGITNIFVVDNVFNAPIDHAESICREIIKRNISVSWSCYANPRFVTHRLIDLMIEAGCTSVEFGSDSADDVMLGNLGKNFTVDDLRNASAVCRDAGMSFCHSLIIGGPGETPDSVHHTFNTVNDMSPTAVICMIGIRIFPGTTLSSKAMKEGYIAPNTDFLKPVFYLSEAIEHGILPFVEQYSQTHSNWIFPGLNINMTQELQKKLRRFGVRGPLWEYMRRRRGFLRTR
ncbi:MAG TPA: radical SAM protein [Deltaproteobacteria bacterium]|nr:radical SAM protein [Deltaproteobacteria bacterium]HEU20594.1 radical SAM protein [Deltaproteobacteria bacterium]